MIPDPENLDKNMFHRKKPGRKKSPRTYQLHPKVMPEIGEAITKEAEQKGLTQGQVIESMWQAYSNQAELSAQNKKKVVR